MNKAIFLDRDGVINKRAKEHDYIKSWEDFEFLPDVAKTIKELNKNFLVVVVSNQRGISRGMLRTEDLEKIHKNMKAGLKKNGAKIDAIYSCPHSDNDSCNCRKPKPGLILQAAKDLDIDLNKSFVVGDSKEDIEAGKAAGCQTIFLGKKQKISDILKIIEHGEAY